MKNISNYYKFHLGIGMRGFKYFWGHQQRTNVVFFLRILHKDYIDRYLFLKQLNYVLPFSSTLQCWVEQFLIQKAVSGGFISTGGVEIDWWIVSCVVTCHFQPIQTRFAPLCCFFYWWVRVRLNGSLFTNYSWRAFEFQHLVEGTIEPR